MVNPLPIMLMLVFWLFLDFTGLFLSVTSTTFYFGWEGLPGLVLRIFGIALLTFSAPVVWRFVCWRFPLPTLTKSLLGLQIQLYLLVSLAHKHPTHASEIFAWTTVAGLFVSGLCLMALLRQIQRFAHPLQPFIALSFGVLLYLGTRLSLQGIPLFLAPVTQLRSLPLWLLLLIPGCLVISPLLTLAPTADRPEPSALGWRQQTLGLVPGLLTGLSAGLIYNLHIWSAQTADVQAAVYLLPLSLGTGLAWFLFARIRPRIALLALAALGLLIALDGLLYRPYELLEGLCRYGCGALGLTLLWLFFFNRFYACLEEDQNYFPVWGLQTGFVLLLLILTLFLLKANPNGFWLALILTVAALWIAGDAPETKAGEVPGLRSWYFALATLLIPGLLALVVRPAAPTPESPERLRVMSSNIRYGWTDTYQMNPQAHLKWLKTQPVDILGLQEVNKGHTSGAYTDLFRLYQQSLPGQWRYGDAHYGFGNALMSRLPILSSEVRHYRAKDMLRRSCLKTTLQYGEQPIDVYVTHLSHLPAPNPIRLAQMQELMVWLYQSRNPWILIGDFNARPDSQEVQLLRSVAHPIFQQQPTLLQAPSFPATNPRERIDYIFFSADFQLHHQSLPETGATSDHRPILTELSLP